MKKQETHTKTENIQKFGSNTMNQNELLKIFNKMYEERQNKERMKHINSPKENSNPQPQPYSRQSTTNRKLVCFTMDNLDIMPEPAIGTQIDRRTNQSGKIDKIIPIVMFTKVEI